MTFRRQRQVPSSWHLRARAGRRPRYTKPSGHTAFYDLFRVQNGKIAEHWDTTIPAKEQWENQNGKF